MPPPPPAPAAAGSAAPSSPAMPSVSSSASTVVVSPSASMVQLERAAKQEQYGKDDPALSFFEQPHTITALVALFFGGLYVAIYKNDGESLVVNTKWGLFAAAVVFVFIGTIMFQNGPFIRPHPIVWRGVLAVSVLYEMFLVYLLFQNADDARQLFKHVNPSLGVPLPERSYAENCAFDVPTISSQTDVFVVAHALGWWAKALILRDFWLTWIISIMFEVMEYSLEHHLPNFAECWWDHWLLDVLLCNGIGIWAGMKTLHYLENQTYDWRGWDTIKTRTGKVKRMVQQFTPYTWDVFEWSATKTFRRWVAAAFVVVLFLQVELNCFYLKYLLWFPPEELLNTYRLVLHFFFGVVGVRECYQYVTDKRCKRLGSQTWMCIAIIQTETLLCVKWGKGHFVKPWPREVLIGLGILIGLWALYTVIRFTPSLWNRIRRKTD